MNNNTITLNNIVENAFKRHKTYRTMTSHL